MPLTVIDEPADRPEWIRETIRLLAHRLGEERSRLLARVAAAGEDDLVAGSDGEWGLGQVAAHLLIVERGVLGIALRLARGETPGPTGQPRPAAAEVTRAGLGALADRAERGLAAFTQGFPAAPDAAATARHPFYGDLNCFGWLLTLPNHYTAHLMALDGKKPSTL